MEDVNTRADVTVNAMYKQLFRCQDCHWDFEKELPTHDTESGKLFWKLYRIGMMSLPTRCPTCQEYYDLLSVPERNALGLRRP